MSTAQPASRHKTFPVIIALRFAVTLCLACTVIGTAVPAAAQERPPGAAATDTSAAASGANGNSIVSQLAPVIVTGTSIQSPETSAYQSAPISVVTADAIQRSGASSLEDYFQSQPDFVLSGQSSYTNNNGTSGATGTNTGATTLNLRGIGPQYTLVLLNGRRFQAEDPANIDLIPVGAIERVDVLKSGASAIYGSDAVAGVVNIITKTKANGWSFDDYFGESGQGDNQNKRFSVSWGTSTDTMDLFLVAEYYDRAGLTQGQRSLSADPDLSRFNSNFDYQAFAYTSLAQIILPNGTGPLVLNQQEFTCGQYSRNPADYVPLNSHLYATTGCDVGLNEDKRSLINPQRKGTFFGSLDYKLSHDLTLYTDFDFARDLVQSVANLFGADGYGDSSSPLYNGLTPIPANYYWNPFGVPITAVTYGLPEGGPQTDDIDTSAGRLNLGIRGVSGRVHYDVGGSYYYNYANAFDYNMPTNPGLYAAEHRPGAEALNLFCNACNTPAQMAGIMSGTGIQDWEESALVNAHAYAPIYTLPAGDVNLALGTEYQRDAYIVQPSQAILDHIFSDFYTTPISAGRRYTAAYTEAQVPIFGNSFAFPGMASLGLDVAARYEKIQAVGSSTDPTVSLRWKPVAHSLAIRGSYGKSFRAPPLTDLDAPVTTTNGAALINPVTGLSGDYNVTRGGNPNLKPETGTYLNYGIVLTPQFLRGLTLQLDRWFINQKNIVIETSPQLVLDGVQPGTTFIGANGLPGVVSLYMNAAGQKVNGTDLDLDYRFRTDRAGLFDFHLAGTYLNSFKVNDDNAAGYVQYAGGTVLASSLPSVTGMPKPRFLLAANWAYRALTVTYLLHYTGSYEDPTIPGGVEVSRYVTHDLQFGLDLGEMLASDSWLSSARLTFGVNDLTYAKVPIFYAGPSGAGLQANGYDTSIVDPTGRFFYAAIHLTIPNH